MDEHLFIILAKLQADRRKLAREQAGAQLEFPGLEPSRTAEQPPITSSLMKALTRGLQWRTQS